MIRIFYHLTKEDCPGFYLFEEGDTFYTPEDGELILERCADGGAEFTNEHGEIIVLTEGQLYNLCAYNKKRLFGVEER